MGTWAMIGGMFGKPHLKPYEGKFKSIVLFGPPGSGKGTLGKALEPAGGLLHLSSGDIFRGLSPDSPGGMLFTQYAGVGKLVPDDATLEIWLYYVNGLVATNRYFPDHQLLLVDGVPRTENQAKVFEPYLDVLKVISLEGDEEVFISRMQGRALKENRSDDADLEVLRTRMEVYQEQTSQVLSHYPMHQIVRVDATQNRVEVLRDVLIALATDLVPFQT